MPFQPVLDAFGGNLKIVGTGASTTNQHNMQSGAYYAPLCRRCYPNEKRTKESDRSRAPDVRRSLLYDTDLHGLFCDGRPPKTTDRSRPLQRLQHMVGTKRSRRSIAVAIRPHGLSVDAPLSLNGYSLCPRRRHIGRALRVPRGSHTTIAIFGHLRSWWRWRAHLAATAETPPPTTVRGRWGLLGSRRSPAAQGSGCRYWRGRARRLGCRSTAALMFHWQALAVRRSRRLLPMNMVSSGPLRQP